MRKSIVNELQTEEAAVNSPVRRSSRIVNANITPAGIPTRRTSQTTESDAPAKVTRGRRASTQAAEEKVETKTAVSKRASILVEDNSQKEPTTPARRGRKPSVTSETTDKETEKPKPTRGRRPSVTNSEDNEEDKPQKIAPVRSRRSSAAIDPESEVKPVSKTPARATTRRRSSAAENALIEEVSTPSQRPTRGRRASDAAEVVEEAKKPVTRGRRKSVNVEEETIVEEVTKPAPRRSRRISTDDVVTNIAPKTPVRSTRRSLINLEPESKDIATDDKEIVDKDELSPTSLKENIVFKVTPLKKRKIVEKIESELDLSIINESADDINISKNESLKEIDKNDSPGKVIKNVLVMSSAKDLINISQPAILSKISESRDNSPSSRGSPISRKRLSTGVDESPPRKSPRLTEKSRSNTPQKELTAAEPSPRKSPRLNEKTHSTNSPRKETYPQSQKSSPQKTLENAEKEDIQESHVPKLYGSSCVSSGSEGSFRFHLSTVSMADSTQSSNQENLQENLLNTSIDSTGSNKENLEVTDCTKSGNKSVVIPIQEPIIVSRVSNVFKPNQRECSFMEPMEVDESLLLADSSILNKSVALDESSVIFTKNTTKSTGGSASESANNSEQEEPSIILCNKFLTNDNATGAPAINDKNVQENPNQLLHKLQSEEFSSKLSCTETEGSDNILIEETEGTVYMCVKPTPKKLLVSTSTSPIKRQSRSPTNIEASFILNDPIDKVKILLSRKSSSPLNIKRRSLRKSKSPLDNNDSTDSENEERGRLRVSKPTRRSKTPSPLKDDQQLIVPRISKSPSAKGVSDLKQGDVDQAELVTRKSRSKSKSPVPVSHSDKSHKGVRVLSNMSPIKRNILSISPGPGSDDKEQAKSPGYYNEPTLTGNRAARSKSKSPLPQTSIRGIIHADNKSPVLDRSFENPRESEEMLISNEKIVLDTSINTKNTEKVQESMVKTLGLIVEESSNQMPHFDQSVSVETMNTDPTEYHTAVAITNNDSEFNSIVNTDNDITQSGGKHSESTHYDFDMPSDDDDLLLESKGSTGDKPVNSSILDKSRGDEKVPSRKSAGNVSKSMADDSEKVAEKFIENKAPSSTSLIDSDSEDDVFEENQNADISVNVKQDEFETLNDNTELDTSKVNDIEMIEDICESNVDITTDCETSSKPDKEGSDDDLSHPSNEQANECPKTLPVLPKVRSSLNEAKTDLENKFSQENEVIEANIETRKQNESELVPEKEVTKPNDVSAETNIGDSESVPETKEVTNTNDVSAETNIGDSESVPATNESPKTKEVEKEAYSTVESKNELLVSSSSSVDIIGSKQNATSVSDASNLNNKNLSENENKLELSSNLEEYTTGTENEKLDKTQEDITTCKITKKAENMETESLIGKSPSAKDRNSESVKSRPSLDEFASAKLSEYLKSKAKEIEESSSDEDEVDEEESASEKEYNIFIDGMAEEGEEDTPSEDSNEIIDEGESIGSSDSDDAALDDDYDGNDSFICDEDDVELLSGGEYDLSNEKKTKSRKSRIINPDTLGDEDIIMIPKKKANEEKPKRKSRIIKVSDSSEDETNLEVEEIKMDEALNVNDSSDESVILLEDTKYEEDNKNESVKESVTNIIETVDVDKVEIEEPKIEQSSSVILIDDSKAEVCNDESVIQNEPLSALNTSLQKRHRKSSLTIQESIIIDGIKDPTLSKRINSLVESFCSTVKKGEISLNLSLEFEDSADNSSAKDSDKTESVHILSNVTICPSRDVITEHKQEQEVEPEIEKELSTSVGHVEDLRQVINTNKLKRRLSKSVVNTEQKQEEEIEPNETEIEEELNTSVGQVEDLTQVINTNKLERRLSKTDVNSEQKQQEQVEPNEADIEEELSTSVDQLEDLEQAINTNKLKRRLSKSLTEIYDEDKKAKKRKKNSKKDKKYSSDEKLNKKKNTGYKFRPDITEKDMFASFGLMNQLITDVKNRPRRLLKPTVTVESEAASSWIATKVSNLKPSTSPVSRHERVKVVPKLHPKDFKNKLLSDVGRVKRVETATLLKKKGVFL